MTNFSSTSHRVLKIGIVSFVLIVCAYIYSSTTVYAQEAQAGVSVSPVLIEETLDPSSTKEYIVNIKNLNNVEQIFYVTTRDISDVLEGGIPVFAKSGDEKTGMELSDWLRLSTDKVTLAPGASERVIVTLTLPADAAPGSHFGSVFVTADPPEIQNSGAAIGYQVANIISIRVTGDVNEGANIREFSTEKYFNGSKNVDFSVRIENTGNVLIRPVGPLEITNMLGQKVDSVIFNEQQNAVFPGKVREYSFNWTGSGTGFGRYEAIVSPQYGDNGARKTLSSTVSFWILPMNIIGPALAILGTVLLLTFAFVRMYIRRQLAHLSQGQGRIVSKRKQKSVSAALLLVVVLLTVTALFLLVLLVLFA
jgi:hypothetical protein